MNETHILAQKAIDLDRKNAIQSFNHIKKMMKIIGIVLISIGVFLCITIFALMLGIVFIFGGVLILGLVNRSFQKLQERSDLELDLRQSQLNDQIKSSNT